MRRNYLLPKNEKGYIAIIVALIFSAITIAAAFSVGTSGLLSRNSKVDFANKAASFAAARACLDRARLQLSQNSLYAGNESLQIYDYQCTVVSVETSGPNRIIKTSSSVFGATTNLRLTVDSSFASVSFEEVVSH